jgi:hypothetical protein
MTATVQSSRARLTSNEIEAANRAEATALLIRAGFRVYRPEADCYGEDMVIRLPEGELASVQLKSRPTVHLKKYGGDRRICMLFPDPDPPAGIRRQWYLIGHAMLYDWVKAKHGHTAGWSDEWSYPTISRELRVFLEPHRLEQWDPAKSTETPS